MVTTPGLDSVWIPASNPNSKRLLIALHGLGDSVEGYRWLPEALRLEGLNVLLVNAPDEYYGGFSWYDLYGDADAGVRRSRGLLTGMLDSLVTQGFPSDQTTLFGFSQGCLMTIDVGLRYANRLAGLVGVSGYVHDLNGLVREFSPVARRQRLLMTHGLQDPLIPFAKVRRQMEGLREAGIAVEWHEFDKVHTIAGEDEMAVIRDFIASGF